MKKEFWLRGLVGTSALALLVGTPLLAGCDDSPDDMEDVGEAIDDANDEMQDAAEDAADDLEDVTDRHDIGG